MAKIVDGTAVPSMLNMKNIFDLIINTLDVQSFFKHTFIK